MPGNASNQVTTTATGNYKANPSLLTAGFNQDATCISVGTRKGYSINNCDPFGRVYSRTEGATSIVEMLFCTSLVALVGAGDRPGSSTRKLQIVNTKRQSTICELSFPTSVLAVKLNRRRLVVVLEEQIYVYDISSMKLLHTIETSPNPQAICSLAPSSDNSYLAYPSPLPSPSSPFSSNVPSAAPLPNSQQSAGDVIIFDALTPSVTNIIQAHKSPLACLQLNSTGTLLATSSDKGTVIRVFSIPNGDKIHQFRRGTYTARIFSINFNPMSTLLAVSSDTETVHIYKLALDANGKSKSLSKADSARRAAQNSVASGSPGSPGYDDDDEASQTGSIGRYSGGAGRGGYDAYIDSKRNQGMSGSLRKKSLSFGRALAGSVGGFLPGTVTEMWDPQRDFAFLKLPTAGVKSVVALSGTNAQVMVVTSEGIYYCYNIDLENGGECVLQKSYSLMEPDDGSSISTSSD